MVDELTAEMRGTWLVTSQGSTHYFDLDERTYTRIPGRNRQSFLSDTKTVPISEIRKWPKVGDIFFVFLDHGDHEQWRQSSTIVSIELVGGWTDDE